MAEIKDRNSICDHVCDYMHEHHRALGIDALLARPADALVMGLAVGVKSGRLKKADVAPLLKQLGEWQQKLGEILDVADEVCRAALASRKRGDLKRDRY